MWAFGALNAVVALLLIINASAEQYGKDRGFFRFGCHPLVTGPVDPIAGNGIGAYKHTHYVFGSNAMAAKIDEMLVRDMDDRTSCTTCEIDSDRSLYWFPAMMVKRPDGRYNLCKAPHIQVYYLDRGNLRGGQTKIATIPVGLRMIAGDTDRRTPLPESVKDVTSQLVWKALDYMGCDETTNGFPSSVNCGIWQPRINFPNCWDGKNLYKKDMSHISYRGPDNACPDSHPVLMPELFMEIDIYASDCVKAAGATADDLILANGDKTGYGWHADFISGWNTGLLQRAINMGRPLCYVSAGNAPGSTTGYGCSAYEQSEPKCFAFSPEECDALTHPLASEYVKRRNGDMLGYKFCVPVAAFPDAAVDGVLELPSESNPGTIDIASAPNALASIPPRDTSIPDGIGRYAPIFLRTATNYNYCGKTYDYERKMAKQTMCNTGAVQTITNNQLQRFYLIPADGASYVTHLSHAWLVSETLDASGNPDVSSCQVMRENNKHVCKWPLYQKQHLLKVHIHTKNADGVLRNRDLISLVDHLGRRLMVNADAELVAGPTGGDIMRSEVFQVDSDEGMDETLYQP